MTQITINGGWHGRTNRCATERSRDRAAGAGGAKGGKDPALQAKIKQLVAEARQKHIYTIAERVQDANTMAVLWQLGISYIQGNYVQNREIVIESIGTQTLKVKLMESVQ